ncbi:Choline transporter-like protein 1 [Aphelenchoides besseyi]|nr:Choline transporter-like protein 1 [Aphelenchoides besseyi]
MVDDLPIYAEISDLNPTMRAGQYEFLPAQKSNGNRDDQWIQRPQTAPAVLIGQKAARFDLPERLLTGKPSKSPRFNPVVLTHRSCTDPLFAVLFVLFVLIWIFFVGWIAYSNGRPERFKTVFVVLRCNALYQLHNVTLQLFYTSGKSMSSKLICVSRCPTAYFSYVSLATLPQNEFRQQIAEHAICHYTIDVQRIANFSEYQSYVQSGLCVAYTVPSAALLGRCVPGVFVDATNTISGNMTLNAMIRKFGDGNGLVASDEHVTASLNVVEKIASADNAAIFQKIVVDISVSWQKIVVLLAAAAVASFLWTILMRVFGGFMIWLSIFLLVGGLGVGCFFCYMKYDTLRKAGAINDYSFTPVFSAYFEMPNTWFAFAIVLGVLEVIVFLVMLVIRKRVRIAVALIGETSKALGNMLSTLFFPIITSVLHLGVFALWGTMAVWLSSIGTENCIYVGTNPNDPKNGQSCRCDSIDSSNTTILTVGGCRFANLTKPEDQISIMQAYNLFACFWVSCFISALSDMTVAGSFASWLQLASLTSILRKPQDVPSFLVLRSMGRAIRYHLGTLAFGSLILSITKMLRVLLDFLYNKMKGWENPIGKAIYRALTCLFWCLEKILRFLTTNAYIYCAIYGRSFCASSRDSFTLLTRNLIRAVVLNRTVAFLLLVGRLVITGGIGAVAFYYFSGRWVIDEIPQVTLHYYFVPIIAVIIGTYFICDLFFEVYDMGADTIFLCFLEDSESNDGTPEKPFYMSNSLKKILGKENNF